MGAKKRIAIVHDALVVHAGSEKVALHLSNIYPDAPVYTSAYLPENTFPEFKTRQVITLPFANMVRSERHFKQLFLLWYLEFNRLDLSGYDVVISSANYLAKFINPPAGVRHICYLHNAFRFLWKRAVYSEQSLPYSGLALRGINLFIPLLQRIDAARTRKIMDQPRNAIITNSQNMARHLQAVYGLTPEVVYPPVPVSSFWIADSPQDYYLYAGRLISHKRVDIVIEACRRMGRKLVVAGDGLERPILEKLAGDAKNGAVTFTGKVPDAELRRLYANCRALIFPSNEDFGIVPVEAQAAGRPVIAYGAGGALETVVEFETGLFFKEQSVDALCEAMRCFEQSSFDPIKIRQNAMRFDQSHFEEAIRALVDRYE